jgi:pimeloyl-ACP methyl ester carboxylesterase
MRYFAGLLAVSMAGSCGSNGMGAGAPDAADDPVTEVAGCDGAALLGAPDDLSRPGPWAVGARTATIGRLAVEVWYPAEPGSEAGLDNVVYDLRQQLPPSQQGLIPDADNPWQPCDCYRDLPIDAGHGPYPVIVFVHGTASFRTQSLPHVSHWASRGFVVLAADHPGLKLADTLALLCPDDSSGNRDLAGDVDAILAAVAEPAGGDLAFLAGHLASDRVGLVGHSAGAGAIAGLTDRPGVRVVVPFSAGATVADGPALESVLYLSGMADGIAEYSSVESGYQAAPGPKWLVGVADAGHLIVSDLCDLANDEGQNLLEIAQQHDVCGTQIGGALFDCDPAYIDGATGWPIVNFATTAVLEGALHCSDRAGALDRLQDEFTSVGDYRHDP